MGLESTLGMTQSMRLTRGYMVKAIMNRRILRVYRTIANYISPRNGTKTYIMLLVENGK